MTIQFFFIDVAITVTDRKRLKLYLHDFFINHKRDLVSLVFIFCTDDYLLDINKQFLQHDYFTDIITFNLSDNVKIIEGEIYISVDRIKDNARINNVSIKLELHRVMFHGALHLCGFKDNTPSDKTRMTSLENANLQSYFS